MESQKFKQWITIGTLGAAVLWMIHAVYTVGGQQQEVHVEWIRAMRAWEGEMRLATGEVKPADVLEEVNRLHDDVEELKQQIKNGTDDRFRGADFEAFLDANPELKPPKEE